MKQKTQYGVTAMFKTGQTVLWVYDNWIDAMDHAERTQLAYDEPIVVIGTILSPQKSRKKTSKRPQFGLIPATFVR